MRFVNGEKIWPKGGFELGSIVFKITLSSTPLKLYSLSVFFSVWLAPKHMGGGGGGGILHLVYIDTVYMKSEQEMKLYEHVCAYTLTVTVDGEGLQRLLFE